MDEKVLSVVEASGPRRVIALAMLVGLGGLLLYIAFATPPRVLGWQLFLLVAGAGALWLAERMRRATAGRLVLTARALTDADGTVLARIDELEKLDRGVFAFKPSSGFLLKLRHPGPAEWRPGLWWRLGRRVGVGGVTPRYQTRAMAELIELRLARRDASDA
ncbi:MAG: hypothetical protein ACLFRU_11165 [Paracoccaceae bacterium]